MLIDISSNQVPGEDASDILAARSGGSALAPYDTQDSTFAVVTFADGTIWSIDVSWGMPAVWPAEVYSSGDLIP
jgi:hypothetical protein